jgi:hypothetical protein
MIDESNTNTDASESYPADKAPRVHLLVQRVTHDMIETTRVAMRRAGLANVPEVVAKILEKDWTSDTMVWAGCTAIQTLLQPPEPQRYGKKAEAYIAHVQATGGYLPGIAGRIRAIDDIVGGAAEALRAEFVNAFEQQEAAAVVKPAAKGKAKR